MINKIIHGIIKDINKIIIASISLKIVSFIILCFALEGQSSGFYESQRFILCPIFFILALLDHERGKKFSIFFWICFATLFNPIMPIYLQESELWKYIDGLSIITILATLFIHDMIWFNNPFAIAEHIYRTLVKDRRPYIPILFDYVRTYFEYGLDENITRKKQIRYWHTAKELLDILSDICGNNSPEDAEINILWGIEYSRVDPSYPKAMKPFKRAHEINNVIRVPKVEEISELNFKNYKDKLFTLS